MSQVCYQLGALRGRAGAARCALHRTPMPHAPAGRRTCRASRPLLLTRSSYALQRPPFGSKRRWVPGGVGGARGHGRCVHQHQTGHAWLKRVQLTLLSPVHCPQAALQEGMESLSQAKVGSALQVYFFNLEELPQVHTPLSTRPAGALSATGMAAALSWGPALQHLCKQHLSLDRCRP
jgi:hypothetical protein